MKIFLDENKMNDKESSENPNPSFLDEIKQFAKSVLKPTLTRITYQNYLLQKRAFLSYSEAFRHVKSKRTVVNPNNGY